MSTPSQSDVPQTFRQFWMHPASYVDTQSFIAVFLVFAFVAIIIILVIHPLPADNSSSAPIYTLIGVLGTMATGVATFYFGSSKGSAAKDDANTATMKTLVDKMVEK